MLIEEIQAEDMHNVSRLGASHRNGESEINKNVGVKINQEEGVLI